MYERYTIHNTQYYSGESCLDKNTKNTFCGRRCLAALNKFHKIQQNEIEQIRGIVLINIYTCDIDIDSSSEPSSNKL